MACESLVILVSLDIPRFAALGRRSLTLKRCCSNNMLYAKENVNQQKLQYEVGKFYLVV